MAAAKLTAILLLTLVALTSASSFTTTVVTTSHDDDANPRQQQCRQMVQGRQFRPCQRFLEHRGGGFEEAEEVIEMRATGGSQQHLQECCQQLKEMDRQQCGCEAIKQAVRQVQEGGGRSYRTGQSDERIYERARDLPRKCNLSQQQCRFHVVLV